MFYVELEREKPVILEKVPLLDNKQVNIEYLLEKFNGMKILNNLVYKKGYTWSVSKEKNYVYDLLIGLPVNKVIVLNYLKQNEVEVLEGYNRLIAVKKFMEGKLLIRGYNNNDLISYVKNLYLDFFEGYDMEENHKEIYSRNLNTI